MGIYIFCFLIGLAFAAVPFVAQLVVCMNTENLPFRLIPVLITGSLYAALTFATAGTGLYEIFTTSLFFCIAHRACRSLFHYP